MDTEAVSAMEEQQWREKVFRGNSMPESTPRAIIAGIILGVLIMSQNVYLGLKTGLAESGSILSAIVCFAVFRSFKSNLNILENNLAQTMSTAAGSFGVIVSAVPALQLAGYNPAGWQIFIWLLLIGILGLMFAIPFRRQLISVEQLTFPTGTACATTLTAMHSHGDQATGKARALGITGLCAAAVTWFRDAVPAVIPNTSSPSMNIGAYRLEQLTIGFYWSPLAIGVGLMVGIRIGFSLLLGSILCWGVLGPLLAGAGVIESMSSAAIRHWVMWPAIALMVSSGFTSLALRGPMIARSFRSMLGVSLGTTDLIEFPGKLWLAGIIMAGAGTVIAAYLIFQVPFWLGMIVVVLAFFLAMVSMRAYGETDVNPIGTMGHANQILTGILSPGHVVSNLSAGSVSAGCSDISASLMQTLKTGYLLGGSPRRQIFSQCIGVLVGAITSVAVFQIITRASALGSEAMPAPGALPWVGVAKLVAQGTSALPAYSLAAIGSGALAGIIITLLEKTPARRYIPSPFGIGIGLVIPAFFSVSIFTGSLIGMFLEKKFSAWAETYLTPIASGGITGEAIMGILISMLAVLGIVGG